MTTVPSLLRRADPRRVEGKLQWAVLLCLLGATNAAGQQPPVHWRHAGAMPPGAIGRQRLLRGGPLSGYCQPVELRAPQGARVVPAGQTADAADARVAADRAHRLLVGLEIGPVYRFHVTDIPEHPGVELFPTVEMVDRTYPPRGLALRFPVPIDLTEDELLMAAEGRFVTRIIYIEDPNLALPIAEKAGGPTRWHEVRTGDDPLVAADSLGRPIAILRIGGRVPDATSGETAETCGPQPVVYDQPPVEPQ